MKYYPVFAIVLISLLSLSVSESWASSALAEQSVDKCMIDTSEERAIIKNTKGKAIRQGDKLNIKTRQGQIVFENNCNSENVLTEAYELEAYFGDVQYFLVRNVAVPYSEYILVDEKTAAKTVLYGFPVFSPDRQRFAAMVIDDSNGLTSIEIYRIIATGLQLEYNDTTIHATTQPRWKNNSTINFKRTLTLSSTAIPAIIQLKRGIWKLT